VDKILVGDPRGAENAISTCPRAETMEIDWVYRCFDENPTVIAEISG